MERTTKMKKGFVYYCLIMVIVVVYCIPLSTSHASAIPSYDLENIIPAEPRDYQQVLTPTDIVFDDAGNTYVADAGHHAMIKYDATGRYVTHWNVFNPTAIAIDSSSNQIYIGLINNEVHIFDDRGNALHTFGERGTGDGQFEWIRDIAIDDQYIYIADRSNHRIQIFNKSDRSHVYTIGGVVGVGNGELNHPSAITVGSEHQLYVADSSNHRIQLFEFNWASSTWQYHSQIDFLNPYSLHLQESGSGQHTLYGLEVTGAGIKWKIIPLTGHDLDTVDAATIITHTVNEQVFTSHVNTKMAWNPVEEQLYAANYSLIARLDDIADRSKWIGFSSDQFNKAGGIAVDQANHLYITDRNQHRVLKYDQDGTLLNHWGEVGSGDGEFIQPQGIAVDSNGNVYVADTQNYRIQKFKPDGTFERKWGELGFEDGKFHQIYALAIDANDHIYVASWKTVQKFDTNGTHLLTFGDHMCGTTGQPPCSNPGFLQTPRGVGFDSSGNVYITANHDVNKFSASGTFLARWGGQGAELGKLDGPTSIAVDDQDRIHISDRSNHRIQIFQSDGTSLGEFAKHPVTTGVIEDIAIDRTNKLYVIDNGDSNVKIFSVRPSGPIDDLAATGDIRSVILTFSAPNGASSVTVKQREVGAATWIKATTQWSVTASSTTATVTGLEENAEYEFYLEVTDGPHAGNSNIASAKTSSPIDDLAAIGGNREITLTFSPPTGATSVTVKIWLPGATVWTDATTTVPITSSSTSATVTGLADDTYYHFFLEVIGGARAGMSNSVGATTNGTSVTPIPIDDLTATGGDGKITLNFSAPTGATYVTVKQTIPGSGVWTDATTESVITETTMSAVVTGLVDDTTYVFYLEVVGGEHAGNSNTARATTNAPPVGDTSPPEWPLSSELILSEMTETSVQLSWPEASDNIAVTGYRVYVDDHLEVDQLSEDYRYSAVDHEYMYTMVDLQPDTTYRFTVKAYDASGNVSEPGLSETASTLAPSTGDGGGYGWIWISSDNANLKHLEIQAADQLVVWTPEFRPEITEYTVETEARQVEFKAVAEHYAAKVYWQEENVNDQPVLLDLQDGDNVIQLNVEAEDRSNKIYTITILRHLDEGADGSGSGGTDGSDALFSDTVGHWAESYIREAVVNGIVQGFPDGTFRPDHPVTRAEFAVMLVKALSWDRETEALQFSDHHEIGNWARGAVALAVHADVVQGYPDGSFKPDHPITRAEMATMIARALQLSWDAELATSFADDGVIPIWAKGAIEAIRQQGMIEGRGGNRFVPHETATRAEAVVVLLRMME